MSEHFSDNSAATSWTIDDLTAAHKFSSNHKPELQKDHICGCFYCLSIFSPTEISDWYIGTRSDLRGTAFCPYCHTDSIIGESSGYPITEAFLKAMKKYYF